jgi:DHA2 family multidrug resistance protein
MFLFFVFTWMLSNSTLATGEVDVFLPLMIRGVGMALLVCTFNHTGHG